MYKHYEKFEMQQPPTATLDQIATLIDQNYILPIINHLNQPLVPYLCIETMFNQPFIKNISSTTQYVKLIEQFELNGEQYTNENYLYYKNFADKYNTSSGNQLNSKEKDIQREFYQQSKVYDKLEAYEFLNSLNYQQTVQNIYKGFIIRQNHIEVKIFKEFFANQETEFNLEDNMDELHQNQLFQSQLSTNKKFYVQVAVYCKHENEKHDADINKCLKVLGLL